MTSHWRSPEEHKKIGRMAREAVPRELLASGPREPVDVVGLLRSQDADRIADLLPLRYSRMAADEFAFFRGSAVVMAADLAQAPRTGLVAQLCGDAHLANFGVFATPERRLIFDLNDFDETLPGPFEWDVQRLAASICVAGRVHGHTPEQRSRAVSEAMLTYRTSMRDFAREDNLAVWYASLDMERLLDELAPSLAAKTRRRTAEALTRARGRTHSQAAGKLTERAKGGRRFRSDPPLLVPLSELAGEVDPAEVRCLLAGVVARYRASLPEDRRLLLDQYRLVDLARKVVGVGSVGTRAWVLLFAGRDDDDCLLLQAKEAGTSVLEPYCEPSVHERAGHRVVAGQRLMQAASDLFLGYQATPQPDGGTREYYVRQLRDGKLGADLTRMRPRQATRYAQLCGWTLARAHARSGDRIAIAAYLGKGTVFEEALAEFAERYADRVEDQYAALLTASRQGDIPA